MNTKYPSLILGEKIIQILDEAGISTSEKHSALDVARAIVPVSIGSVSYDTRREEEDTPTD
jgi:hypothetical protein